MDPRLAMELCWVFEREASQVLGWEEYPRRERSPAEVREGLRLRANADELAHVARFDGFGENSGTDAVFGPLHARYFGQAEE